jgi:hypothetical protein
MISYRCPDCRTPLSGNGVGEAIVCGACGNESEVPLKRPSATKKAVLICVPVFLLATSIVIALALQPSSPSKEPVKAKVSLPTATGIRDEDDPLEILHTGPREAKEEKAEEPIASGTDYRKMIKEWAHQHMDDPDGMEIVSVSSPMELEGRKTIQASIRAKNKLGARVLNNFMFDIENGKITRSINLSIPIQQPNPFR